MREYEIMFILRPDLDKDKMSGVLSKIKEIFSKYGAQEISFYMWAEKRKLAYPIRSSGAHKQKFEYGTYVLGNFKMPQDKLKNLDFDLHLVEEILRWLIVRKEERK